MHHFIAVVPDIQTPTDPDAFIVGTLGMICVMLVAGLIYLVKTFRTTKETEKSVNNVRPGEPTLREIAGLTAQRVEDLADDVNTLVEAQAEFQRAGWASLPDDINTSAKLTETIRGLQGCDKDIQNALKRIEDTLIEHAEWEKETIHHRIDRALAQRKEGDPR